MALALLFEDDSVMYLDAVENYTKSYNSSISNHPIDKSAIVTDHVSKDNPIFSIKGVISAADFHTFPSGSGEGDPEVLDREPVAEARIKSVSNLLDYLPGSVQQFISAGSLAEVEVDEFRGFTHQAARDRLDLAWRSSELITLLDYDFDNSTGRSSSVKAIENCLIQNYTDNEDAETGDSFEFTITFQKVRFAYLKEVDLRVTQASVSDAASGENDKGEQSDTSGDNEGSGNIWTEYRGLVDEFLGR